MTAKSDADEDGVTSPPKRGPKTFLQTLQEVSFGDAADEATNKLVEALDAAKRLGRSASITVTLDFRPLKNGQVEVVPTVTNKVPKEPLGTHVMFLAEDGTGLQSVDPRQKNLTGIRSVEDERRAPREVAGEAEPRPVRSA